MRSAVIDASVIVKWLLPERDGEDGVEEALTVLQLVRNAQLHVHQPSHWLAEAAAVATRLSPGTAADDIVDLCELNFDVLDSMEVYLTACDLSSRLRHHLFDTLYHAVALNLPDAILITADDRYFRKARRVGHIMSLKEITQFPGVDDRG